MTKLFTYPWGEIDLDPWKGIGAYWLSFEVDSGGIFLFSCPVDAIQASSAALLQLGSDLEFLAWNMPIEWSRKTPGDEAQFWITPEGASDRGEPKYFENLKGTRVGCCILSPEIINNGRGQEVLNVLNGSVERIRVRQRRLIVTNDWNVFAGEIPASEQLLRASYPWMPSSIEAWKARKDYWLTFQVARESVFLFSIPMSKVIAPSLAILRLGARLEALALHGQADGGGRFPTADASFILSPPHDGAFLRHEDAAGDYFGPCFMGWDIIDNGLCHEVLEVLTSGEGNTHEGPAPC